MSEPNSGDVFSTLLSNPAMLSSVAKLLSGMQASSAAPQGAAEGAQSTEEEGVGGGSSPDMSGMISAALSNPQLVAALPKMLETLTSAMPKGSPSAKPSAQSAQEGSPHTEPSGMGNLGALLPTLAGAGSGHKKPPKVTDRRSALLMALKPYMSHDKAEMIDTIVRIIEIMSIIK